MGELNSNKGVLPENQDDFKQIKKIGQSTDRSLHELGLHTFEDLAALTPEYLFNLLQAHKAGAVNLARIQREDWLGQARALAQAKAQKKPAEESTAKAAAADAAADLNPPAEIPGSRTASSADGRDSLPAGSDWLEMADFFVSFGESISAGGKTQVKTRVVYSQLDRHMEWDGIAMDALAQWMSEQGHLPEANAAQAKAQAAEPAEPAQTPTAPAEPHENIRLAVSNVWVSQVPPAELPLERARQRWIRVEASVDLLVDDLSSVLEWPDSFALNILLVNMATNGTLFIELPAMPLVPDEMPYAFRHDFPVPPPGRYQLYLLARLPSAEQVMALQEGPIVRVEG